MGNFLTPADYPIISIGSNVYAKTMSSPICTAMNDFMAADIANRLNREYDAQRMYVPRPEPGTYVGGGLIAVKV